MDRRLFLKTALAGAALSTFPFGPALASASHDLSIGTRALEVRGRAATVYGLTGSDGKSGLTLDAGTEFNVLLRNGLDEATLVHWHGLTPPWTDDGVPGAPAPHLGAGEERRYRFPVGPGGTHWMHAHTLQEQALLAAPLIVRTAEDRAADEQEVVLMLHDFSFKSPEELLAGLREGGAHGHGRMGMTGPGMMGRGMTNDGVPGHGGMGMMGGGMGHGRMMAGTDLNDIEYDAYLANDRTLDDPEIVRVDRNGTVRLRIINAATATAFTVDLGALHGDLIAVDGQPVVPVSGSRFPLAMGQRADVRLRLPAEGGSFPVLALREGAPERTGIVLATTGALVPRLPGAGDEAGPVLDLGLESRLRAVRPLAARQADSRHSVHLSGMMMSGYQWYMHGHDTIAARRGDRVEITMMNMSMMAHPMHLHGHHFQVVAINGATYPGAVRDTVNVPPMHSVTIAVDANNPGRWAFHCHHLYHMAAGMMGTFAYRGTA